MKLISVPAAGTLLTVSVVAAVIVLVNPLPAATFMSLAPIAILTSLVPVIVGVLSVALVLKTKEPVPVSSVTADIRLALDGVAKNVVTPVAKPEIPVEIGNPVAFVNVNVEGVPKFGVTKVGDVANTNEPEPVSSVTADIRLALDGVAKNVVIPVAKVNAACAPSAVKAAVAEVTPVPPPDIDTTPPRSVCDKFLAIIYTLCVKKYSSFLYCIKPIPPIFWILKVTTRI
jgi:hypothetical protein